MITVLYPCHNRLDYVKMTLPALLRACEELGDSLDMLWIVDDNSTDGTSEFIQSLDIEISHQYVRDKIGNSTGALNMVIEACGASDFLAKFDNDILIHPDTILELFEVMEVSNNGAFIMPNVSADSFPLIDNLSIKPIKPVSHIGGVGIFRMEVFRQFGLIEPSIIEGEERFFGFTAYQEHVQRESDWKCYRDNSVVCIDLDASPIYSRVEEYTAKGWGRNIVCKVDSVFNRKYLKEEA